MGPLDGGSSNQTSFGSIQVPIEFRLGNHETGPSPHFFLVFLSEASQVMWLSCQKGYLASDVLLSELLGMCHSTRTPERPTFLWSVLMWTIITNLVNRYAAVHV